MNLAEMKHKYGQLMTQANAIATKGFTTENRSQFDAMIADGDALHADIQRAEKAEKFVAEQRATVAPPRAGFETGTEETQELEKRSFLKWMRTGVAEKRDMGDDSTLTAGAQFVPTIIAPLVDAKKSYGNLLDYVNIFRTETGGQYNIPLTSDVANALTLITAQGTSSTTSVDPTISSVASHTDTAQTLLRISNELLQDSFFDLEAWVRTKLNVRWARGFSNWVSQGNSSNVAALAAAGTTVTSAASGVVAYPDLAALYGALDQSYAGTASWVMSSAVRATLMGLVSTTGQPILQPSPNGDPFGAIFGRPICFDMNRPAIAAGNVPILFGDLSEGYTARVAGFVVKRLDELFSLSNETAFVLYSRVGGVNTDAGTHPVRSLTVHA